MILRKLHHEIWVKPTYDALWDVMGEVEIDWPRESFFPRLAPFRSPLRQSVVDFNQVTAPQFDQAEITIKNNEEER